VACALAFHFAFFENFFKNFSTFSTASLRGFFVCIAKAKCWIVEM